MQAAEGTTAEGGDKLANYLTSLGHVCSDINQGAISAILPFLVVAYGYDYASVAMLVFAANVASVVIQPLFGVIGDKHPAPWLMALGVFLAGLGMTLVGFVGDYWLILACAMLSGVGVAMFHPEGGRLANLAAGARKANGMSVFAVGGNVGFFIGPLLTATFCTAFGMAGTLVFIVPATLCAAVLLAFNSRFVALGMGYVPRHLGMASGVSYGIAVAAGGIAEPFLGMAGDALGLVPVIAILAGVAAAGLVGSLALWRVERGEE